MTKEKKKTTPAKPTSAALPPTANIIRQSRYKYVAGHRFNSLTILKRIPGPNVRCVCDCGKKMTVALRHLVTGSTKSCGCMTTGRPSGFKPEYSAAAEKLCYLGATDKQLADFFGVSMRTILNWKNEHPEFLRLISRAKVEADSVVAQSLFKRAVGYERQEEKLIVADGVVISKKFEKHYPPDTAAATFWLGNRDPEAWRKSERIDVTVKKGEAVVPNVAELERLMAEIDTPEDGVIDIEPGPQKLEAHE